MAVSSEAVSLYFMVNNPIFVFSNKKPSHEWLGLYSIYIRGELVFAIWIATKTHNNHLLTTEMIFFYYIKYNSFNIEISQFYP
jgi:hypothetical protein